MDDMISYVENPKYFIEKLLELINSAKQQDTKSTQKNQLYFHTLTMNNPQRKLRRQFHLHITSKRIKYLGINQGGKRLVQ